MVPQNQPGAYKGREPTVRCVPVAGEHHGVGTVGKKGDASLPVFRFQMLPSRHLGLVGAQRCVE